MRFPRLLLAMLVSIAALVLLFFANSFKLDNAVSALPLVADSRVSAQGQTRQFEIGDRVEVDTFMAGTYPGSEKYATWRKGIIVGLDRPENRFGQYVIKLDEGGSEFRVRFVDTQWIRGPQRQVGAGEGQTIEIGVVYSCNNQMQFRVLSCDARDWCQVFRINKASPSGGFTVPYTKPVLLSDIKSFQCTASLSVDESTSSSGESVDAFSTTINTPPLNARSIELFKPSLGAFTLLNTSVEIQLPSPLLNLSILERARDSAEGTYQGRDGIKVKLASLSYPSVDVSLSMLDRIELEMRRNASQVTMLKRKKGRAFLVELSMGKSFVVWGNSSWLFFSFGGAQEARSLAGSFGY